MAEWLEYGSLGLLALLLVAIGAGAREFLGRWQERQKAALNHQAEADKEQVALEAKRTAARDAFLQSLIEQDREDRARQLKAWQELVAQDIKAMQAQTLAIEGLCERSDRHEQRADERHQNMILLVEQQRKELS